jgi:hypothetical protein
MGVSKQQCQESAFVLKIGDRYFCGFSKTGRAMTAWSLAGAKTYIPFQTIGNEWLHEDLEKLDAKKKKYVRKTISITE